jgi:HEAT repeat protein
LKSPDATVRGFALHELSSLARYSDRVVPVLTRMLTKDEKEYVRRVAAVGLGDIGTGAKSAVPTLKRGLDDPDANIRNAFRSALERIENAKDQPGLLERTKRDRAILKDINELSKARGGK